MGRRKVVSMDIETIEETRPIHQDVWAKLGERLKKGQVYMGARQVGKSMALAAGYGTKTGRFPQTESHPLQYLSGYKHLPRDPRLAGAHLYKTNNQNMSWIIGKGLLVPHTTLNYHLTSMLRPIPRALTQEDPTVPVIAWCRRHTLCELTDAIATLQMMGHDDIAVVRAFEP